MWRHEYSPLFFMKISYGIYIPLAKCLFRQITDIPVHVHELHTSVTNCCAFDTITNHYPSDVIYTIIYKLETCL